MSKMTIINLMKLFDRSNKGEKAVILLNSELEHPGVKKYLDFFWNAAGFRACTDGAANMLFQTSNSLSPPDILSGDFDSVSSEALTHFREKGSEIVETPDPDFTDFTKSLRLVLAKIQDKNPKISDIVALGGINGRFDHTMGCLNSLYLTQPVSPVRIFLLQYQSLVTLLTQGEYEISVDRKSVFTGTCGLIPLGERRSLVTTAGLKWNLSGQSMAFGELVSTSNQTVEDTIKIKTDGPLILSLELQKAFISEIPVHA